MRAWLGSHVFWVLLIGIIALAEIIHRCVPSSWPRRCELCGYTMTDQADRIWWHGYGNCVDLPKDFS